MARIRCIKPGIMTNEDLCELGPYAYILFTGLWMLADREGRLEYRPKRIKAEAMPLWQEVDWRAVENLLEKLCEAGFLHRYVVGGKPYLQIVTWRLHQRPDPREACSVLPAPLSVNGGESTLSDSTVELHRQDSVITMSRRVGTGDGNGNGINVVEGNSASVNENHPPVENPTPPIPPKPRHAPAAQRSAPAPTPRKSMAKASTPARHKAEDVDLVRESLRQLSIEKRMAPPDDDLVRRVLDAAGGASGDQIHEVLVALYKRNKFSSMYSWGFVPLVISQVFKAA